MMKAMILSSGSVKNDTGTNGFTLLEVTIALAIISVVFISLTSLFNATIGIVDYSKKVTVATLIAQKLMTEIELNGDYELGESEEVELEDEYEGYSYKTVMRETMFPLVQELNLIVNFSSVLKSHSLLVTSYVNVNVDEDLIDENEGESKDSGGVDATGDDNDNAK